MAAEDEQRRLRGHARVERVGRKGEEERGRGRGDGPGARRLGDAQRGGEAKGADGPLGGVAGVNRAREGSEPEDEGAREAAREADAERGDRALEGREPAEEGERARGEEGGADELADRVGGRLWKRWD